MCRLHGKLEDTNHIFFHCTFARFMGSVVRELLHCSWNPSCYVKIRASTNVSIGFILPRFVVIDCGILIVLIDSRLITMSHGGLYIKGYKTWRLRNLIEIDLDYNPNIPNIVVP